MKEKIEEFEIVNNGLQDLTEGKINVTPIARMIGNYYESMGYITIDEKDKFVESLCRKPKNKFALFVYDIIEAITGNIVGALLAPALVKGSQKLAMSLEYATEQDAMLAEAKQRMFGEVLESMSMK